MLAATTTTTSRCTRGARDFGEGPAEARGLRASRGGGEGRRGGEEWRKGRRYRRVGLGVEWREESREEYPESWREGGGATLVAGVHGISERAVKVGVALPSPSILSMPSEVITLLKKVNQAYKL